MPNNDNDLANRGIEQLSIDAHGQAALVLVESLIHGLVERAVLTVSQSVEIMATAVEAQAEFARDADGAADKMWQSHSLLSSIAASLAHDLGTTMG